MLRNKVKMRGVWGIYGVRPYQAGAVAPHSLPRALYHDPTWHVKPVQLSLSRVAVCVMGLILLSLGICTFAALRFHSFLPTLSAISSILTHSVIGNFVIRIMSIGFGTCVV